MYQICCWIWKIGESLDFKLTLIFWQVVINDSHGVIKITRIHNIWKQLYTKPLEFAATSIMHACMVCLQPNSFNWRFFSSKKKAKVVPKKKKHHLRYPIADSKYNYFINKEKGSKVLYMSSLDFVIKYLLQQFFLLYIYIYIQII